MLNFVTRQRRFERRWLVALVFATATMLALSLCAGDVWFSPLSWWNDEARLFIWQIRLPRTLAVLLVGAALAVTGTIMQSLFENPLAEPGLLGVSNGAGVALVVALLLGQGMLPGWVLGLCAILGALA
ncbi:iron chelate uptake ABC transporter family permease subunit, partial [Cedecea sp. VD21]